MKKERLKRTIRIQPYDNDDLKLMINLKNMPRYEIKINYFCPIFKLKEMLKNKWFKNINFYNENEYSFELYIDKRCNYKDCDIFYEGIKNNLMVKDLYDNFNLKSNEIIWMQYKIKVVCKKVENKIKMNTIKQKNTIKKNTFNNFATTNNNSILFNENTGMLDKSNYSLNSLNKIENSYFATKNNSLLFNNSFVFNNNNSMSIPPQKDLNFKNLKSKKSSEYDYITKDHNNFDTLNNKDTYNEGWNNLAKKINLLNDDE